MAGGNKHILFLNACERYLQDYGPNVGRSLIKTVKTQTGKAFRNAPTPNALSNFLHQDPRFFPINTQQGEKFPRIWGVVGTHEAFVGQLRSTNDGQVRMQK
jgi:hypothetical protein